MLVFGVMVCYHGNITKGKRDVYEKMDDFPTGFGHVPEFRRLR